MVGEVRRDPYGPILRNPGQELALEALVEHDYEDAGVRWEVPGYETALVVNEEDTTATFTTPAVADDSPISILLFSNLDDRLIAEESVRVLSATLDVNGATADSRTRETSRDIALQQDGELTPVAINTNETVTFDVAVNDDYQTNGAVKWSLQEGVGSVSQAGVYTPPRTLTFGDGDTATLQVESVADLTQYARFQVSVQDIQTVIDSEAVIATPSSSDTSAERTVTLGIDTPVLMTNRQQLKLSAEAIGDLQEAGAVQWDVDLDPTRTTAANPGSIGRTDGLYTPAADTRGQVTLIATSVADDDRSDSTGADVGAVVIKIEDGKDEDFIFTNSTIELDGTVTVERDLNCDGVRWSPLEKGTWTFPDLTPCEANLDTPYTGDSQPSVQTFTPDGVVETLPLTVTSRHDAAVSNQINLHVRQITVDLPAVIDHPSIQEPGAPLQINNNEPLTLRANLDVRGEKREGENLGGVRWSVVGDAVSSNEIFPFSCDLCLETTYKSQSSQGEVTVRATSEVDRSQWAEFSFVVTPIEVSVASATTGLEDATSTLDLDASILNDFRGLGVTWSADGGAIDENGLLQPPYSRNTITVTATSVADPLVSDSVDITLPVTVREISASQPFVNPNSADDSISKDSLVLTAALDNDLEAQGVAWQIVSTDGLDGPQGKLEQIDAYSVRYTPPAVDLQTTARVTIRATSLAFDKAIREHTVDIRPVRTVISALSITGTKADGNDFARANLTSNSVYTIGGYINNWNLNPGDALTLDVDFEDNHRGGGVSWSVDRCDTSSGLATLIYRDSRYEVIVPEGATSNAGFRCVIRAVSTFNSHWQAEVSVTVKPVKLENLKEKGVSTRDSPTRINTDYGKAITFEADFENDFSGLGVYWTISCPGTSDRSYTTTSTKASITFRPPTDGHRCVIYVKSKRDIAVKKEIVLEIWERHIPDYSGRTTVSSYENIYLDMNIINDESKPTRYVSRICDNGIRSDLWDFEHNSSANFTKASYYSSTKKLKIRGFANWNDDSWSNSVRCTVTVHVGDDSKSFDFKYVKPKIYTSKTFHNNNDTNRIYTFQVRSIYDPGDKISPSSVKWSTSESYATISSTGVLGIDKDAFKGYEQSFYVKASSRYPNIYTKRKVTFYRYCKGFLCTTKVFEVAVGGEVFYSDSQSNKTLASNSTYSELSASINSGSELQGLVSAPAYTSRLTQILSVAAPTILTAVRPQMASVINTASPHLQAYSSLLLTGMANTTGAVKPVRETSFDHDRNNFLTKESVPATSGDDYSYGETYWEYDYTPHDEAYAAPATVKRILYAGGKLQYSVTDTYDTSGRLIQSERVGELSETETQTRRTTYTYHAGSAGTVYQTNSEGDPDGTSLSVTQFGDLVKTVKVTDGGSTVLSDITYTYDLFGNPVVEVQKGAFVKDVTKDGTVTKADRVIFRNVNGFGQPVWEYVGTTNGSGYEAVSKSLTKYDATGEVEWSWIGSPDNLTTYSYFSSSSTGKPLGYLESVEGLHSLSEFTYDTYGRVKTETVDSEFKTTYLYDTLDRVVREDRPDDGRTHTHYHPSGTASKVILYDPEATHGSDNIVTEMGVDDLGRVISVSIGDLQETNLQTETTYDAFDRPLSVTNHRLEMLSGDTEKTSYLVYDDFGNVVKEYGAVLRNKGGHYTDSRRPYAEYVYDVFGRQVEARRLLEVEGTATVNRTNALTLSEGETVGVVFTTYDAFDRPVEMKDPEGFTTTTSYDRSSNPIKRVQDVWNSENTAPSNFLDDYDTVTSHTAYNALGQPVKVIDPRGYSRRSTFDLLGNVTNSFNECGVLTHHYQYTVDGLLERVYEPSLSGTVTVNNEGCPTNAPTEFVDGSGDFVATKEHHYGARAFPTETYSAYMDHEANGAVTAKTSFTYDYAGRVLTTTLPDAQDGEGNTVKATVTQSYDARGNLLKLTDAEGFVTTYTYDAFSRVKKEHKEKRVGSAVDDEAFPESDGLITSYTYDTAGNLTQEERGTPGGQGALLTKYAYNSLGKVVAESRPPHPRRAQN